MNLRKQNAFNGPPRAELENDWNKLVASKSISVSPFPHFAHRKSDSEVRFSQDELGEYAGDDSSIELTDGSGYYVTVSVFHRLHCVRRLHQYLYPDDYYEGLSEREIFMLRRHTDKSYSTSKTLCK